jgi:hypothetical protein
VVAVCIPDALRPAEPDTRSFMCGALSERRDAARELAFAPSLLERVVAGCRGSWSCARRARPRARALLTPDCGLATFADTPITAAETAEAQLRTIAEGAEILRRG